MARQIAIRGYGLKKKIGEISTKYLNIKELLNNNPLGGRLGIQARGGWLIKLFKNNRRQSNQLLHFLNIKYIILS